MRILNLFKTYKKYKTWSKIIKLNKKDLLMKGFLINWINELGFVIELKEHDIEDLENAYSQNQFIPRGIDTNGPEKQMTNSRIIEFLESHNTFFLENGLLELIEDDFIIEKSDIKDYTYYITITFTKYYFSKALSFFIYIILFFSFIYLLFTFII